MRVKESDRLEAVAQNLRAMGIQIEVLPDGFVIKGPQPLKGATVETFHDHRIAMAFALAGLLMPGVTILNPGCVAKTYPRFWDDLESLGVALAPER